MSCTRTRYPLLALAALISFTAGCDGAGQFKTESTSVGATPTVSASSTTTAGSEAPEVTTPVSYEAAESAFSEGLYPEATKLFTGYTGTHPENPWGHYMLGMSAWRTGEHDKAVAAFDKALELDANHRKSLFNSSRVLLETGRPKEALERIEKALALEPMSAEGLRLLGRARYELGEVEAAIEAYHRALSIDERDVWSMNNLGLIYIQQGRSSEAIPPLARAVELRSNAPVFQNNLANALERSGYPAAAAKAYEAAIAADSTYGKASIGLARVTGSGQVPETTPVDLVALSNQFQAAIECWRNSGSVRAVAIPEVVGTDSITLPADTATDSVLVSGGPVSETPEECEAEEDL